MVVVNLTRSRAENLGNVAFGLEALAPGGTLVVTGAKGDGVDSLARQVARALPLDGAFVKAHGRVFWLTRPAALPAEAAAWARDAALRPNAEGFLTAPGMFSPDHADPGSRRLAAAAVAGRTLRPGRRPRRRLGLAGAGGARRRPRDHRARPPRGRGAGARRRPRQRHRSRGRASTGPT